MLTFNRLKWFSVVMTLSLTARIAFAGGPPLWAYGYATPPPTPGAPVELSHGAGAPPVPDTRWKHIEGSSGQFTDAQIADGFGPADWFPGDHPQMPEIVARGRKPELRACALCHYPNGQGRSENAGVAGLPVSYFIQTINDFRNGLRKSADPRKGNIYSMIMIAQGLTLAVRLSVTFP